MRLVEADQCPILVRVQDGAGVMGLVADLHSNLYRPRRRTAKGVVDPGHPGFLLIKGPLGPDHHPVGLWLNPDHVLGLALGQPQTPTLAHGVKLDSPMLAKDLAMHVAAADPTPVALDRLGIDPALLESERSIYRTQAVQSGKPEKIIDRIVEGRLDKFLAEICLVEQALNPFPHFYIDGVAAQLCLYSPGNSGHSKFIKKYTPRMLFVIEECDIG